jgi:VPS28 protein
MSSHLSTRPSPYAPPSQTIPQLLPSTISLDEVFFFCVDSTNRQEVKLHNGTPAQRRVWDDLATIYSIIVSLEFVEKAYVRDTITQAQLVSAKFPLTEDIPRNVPT